MVSAQFKLLVLSLLPSALASGAIVQKPGLQLPPSAAASRAQVQQIFTNAFHAYTEFAFGHDDLTRWLQFPASYMKLTQSYYYSRYRGLCCRWPVNKANQGCLELR
jgi:hypothetical protein